MSRLSTSGSIAARQHGCWANAAQAARNLTAVVSPTRRDHGCNALDSDVAGGAAAVQKHCRAINPTDIVDMTDLGSRFNRSIATPESEKDKRCRMPSRIRFASARTAKLWVDGTRAEQLFAFASHCKHHAG